MTLSSSESFSFRMLFFFTCLMWPFPIKVNLSNARMSANLPAVKWIPLVLVNVYIWLFGCTSLLSTLYFGLINPHKDFGIMNHGICFTCGMVFCGVVIIVVVFVQNMSANMSAFEGSVDVEDEIQRECRDIRQVWGHDEQAEITGELLCLFIPAAFSAAVVIPFVALWVDLDCLYFISEAILPPPEYRSLETIQRTLLVRFLLLFIALLEFYRMAAFVAVMSFVGTMRAKNIMKYVLNRVTDFKRFHYYYNCSIMFMKKVDKYMRVGVYIAMTLAFWGLVVCCWICVKRSMEQITPPAYMIVMCFAAGLMLGHIFALPLLCRALGSAEYTLMVQRLRWEFTYARKRTRARKVEMLMARAITPIRFKYGEFWYLNDEFVGEYNGLIVDRVFDAILI